MAIIRRPAASPVSPDENLTRAAQRSHREIYKHAEHWGLETNPLDVEGVIKKFGIKLVREEMDVDLSGYIEKRHDTWVIGINKYQTPRRQRFTLAHELAHFLFDRASLETGRHTDSIMLRSEDLNSVEQRANEFAADLLMPKEQFHAKVTAGIRDVSELSEQFDVSEAAIRYRAYKLGYIKRY